MKSIMYHYVQLFNKRNKYFSYLNVKNFEKQIQYFKKKLTFFDCNELFSKDISLKNKIFFTFDDGLACHYNYVYKILKKEKINGIFYIPTLPFEKKKILNVHKIHLILGNIGPKSAVKKLNELILKNQNLFDKELIQKYKNKIYNEHKKDNDTYIFKSYFNYFIKPHYKKVVIEKLFKIVFSNNEEKICSKFYLSENKIKEMSKNNMIIGSHSVSHNLLSELNKNNYQKEIDESFNFISQFSNKKTFSYPYGGFHSFNKNIENYLDKKKVSFSVNVESRNILKKDLINRRQALPRYDCNEFSFGKIDKIL